MEQRLLPTPAVSQFLSISLVTRFFSSQTRKSFRLPQERAAVSGVVYRLLMLVALAITKYFRDGPVYETSGIGLCLVLSGVGVSGRRGVRTFGSFEKREITLRAAVPWL